MKRADYLEIRIAELTAYRNSCATFVTNKSLRLKAGIADKQIEVLQELLTARSVINVREISTPKTLPSEEKESIDCSCSHCGLDAVITAWPLDIPKLEYCPSCGLDGYGARSV